MPIVVSGRHTLKNRAEALKDLPYPSSSSKEQGEEPGEPWTLEDLFQEGVYKGSAHHERCFTHCEFVFLNERTSFG